MISRWKIKAIYSSLCNDVLRAHTPKTVQLKIYFLFSPLISSICIHKARLVDKSGCTSQLGQVVRIDH